MAPFRFDAQTAIEVILYIANRIDNPDYYRIAKIIYFADKAHLENYGRFICGDSYVAMKDGPVPSGIYDILKAVRGDGMFRLDLDPGFSVDNEKGYRVTPQREADIEQFSDSDLECLDEAIERYSHLSFKELWDLSHQGAWERADRNNFITIEDIAADLSNPDEILEYLKDPYPG